MPAVAGAGGATHSPDGAILTTELRRFQKPALARRVLAFVLDASGRLCDEGDRRLGLFIVQRNTFHAADGCKTRLLLLVLLPPLYA